MVDADDPSVLKPREELGQREHCEQFGVTIYEVVAPRVREIRVHQWWGSRVGDEVSGGASFAQDGAALPVTVTTSLSHPDTEDAAGTVEQAASLRPFVLVSDHLLEIRYPEDFAELEREDWTRWLDNMQNESEAWITNDALWTPASLIVDDAVYDGLQTQVDEGFVAGAFYLPEGRLDVSVEILKPGDHPLPFDELRIVRSADLDRVSWDDWRS